MSNNKELKFQALVDAHKSLYGKIETDSIQLRCEYAVERARSWTECSSIENIISWLENCAKTSGMKVEEISLKEMANWRFSNGGSRISHVSNDFYEIIGLRIQSSKTREVSNGWDQPIVKQVGFNGGVLGLIRHKIGGIPHYLVEAKAEPGNPNLVQLSPTLQATFANLRQVHGGNKPNFSEYFEQFVEEDVAHSNKKLIFRQWLPEDGGRLYKKCNLGVIINIDESQEVQIPDVKRFKWVTLHDLVTLIEKTTWVNPHIRSLICPL
jgi:dTDP-4-dehydro-6-deoxy-alpha-D-glucopyranose 2,3-dehydratase